MGSLPRLELCKLYEHRLHRLPDALKQCDILIAGAGQGELAPLLQRKNRLLGKIKKTGGSINV